MPRADAGYEGIESSKLDAKTIFTSIFVGLAVGVLLLKGAEYLPVVIVKQFTWDDLRLIKVFLAALTMTLIVQAVLAGTAKEKFQFARGASRNRRGAVSVAIGCLVMGIGMVYAASSPELVYIQVGTNIKNEVFTWLIGMAIPIAYGFLYPSIFGKIDELGDLKQLDEYIDAEYWILALPAALLAGLGCFALEAANTNDMKEWIPDPRDARWHPYAVGIALGLMQIPLIMIFGTRIGVLASYTSPTSAMFAAIGKKMDWNVPQYFHTNGNTVFLWQFIMWLSAGVGAALMAWAGHGLSPAKGPTILKALAGGAVMHTGAIMAGGGLFEHFVSGIADLNLESVMGLGCIALGAMVMRFGPDVYHDYMNAVVTPAEFLS